MTVLPGGAMLITEKSGKLKLRQISGMVQDVGLPLKVDYGGQGGLGDVIASPDFAKTGRIYLSWVEAGKNDTRGAAVGTAALLVGRDGSPSLGDFQIVWRQAPASDLGKVIRLSIDLNGKPSGAPQRVTMGHRNILGLQFSPDGRLWDLEHGPAGGDELNLVKPGANYGWPLVSEGRHYSGTFIPHHDTRPDFTAPALFWNPVIAPGGMVFYTGKMWPEWQGQLLIGAMKPAAVVRVRIDGEKASEEARYPMPRRIRAISQADDGALLVLEDGAEGRLLRLSRK